MTISEWLAMEFPSLVCADGPADSRISIEQGGHSYVTLVSGGVKPEGVAYPAWFVSEDEAWASFYDALRKFIGRANHLFWRRHPEGRETEVGWVVSARLVVV